LLRSNGFVITMVKRKFDVRLRKVGNSYVVTIPMDTIERFNLSESDFLALELDTEEIKRASSNKNGVKTK
jgi:antitoxin component of MazEF toxin-antitoxin module